MNRGVRCPVCQTKTRVIDSRGNGTSIYRRRQCSTGHRFTTLETEAPNVTNEQYRKMRREKT